MKPKNGYEIKITKASKEDAKDMIDYLNIVGGESNNLLFGKDEFHMTVEEEEQFIESLKDSVTSALFVGRISGELVCIGAIMSPARERISHQADISLSVKKNFWNIGIATLLMKEMIDFAKKE